jgi:hypothetical protein
MAESDGQGSEVIEALFGGGKFAVSFIESDTPKFQKSRDQVSILDADGRKKWFTNNMHKRLRGRISGPWFGVCKEMTDEIGSSVDTLRRSKRLNSNDKDQIKSLETETVAAIAVSGSARAMEGSAGSAKAYLALLCGSSDPKAADAGIQDTLDDIILHNHPDRLNQVLAISGVKTYFNKMLTDAGINATSFVAWDEKEKKQSEFKFQIDVFQKIVNGGLPLVEKFSKPGERFGEYINETIDSLPEIGDTNAEFVNGRLAADVFLTDIFTRWQYGLLKQAESLTNEVVEKLKNNAGNDEEKKLSVDKFREKLTDKITKMKPIDTWGGDPLVHLEEPSILPRRFKKVYSDIGVEILDKLDAAFRPIDAINQVNDTKVCLLPVSMAVNLKAYDRFSDALWQVIGGSVASGVASFDVRFGESLNNVALLLFQVYGTMETSDGQPIGKELVGLMMARIVECKAKAAVSSTADPSLATMLGIIFEDETKGKGPMPYTESKKALWGPQSDGREGLIANWVSPQMGLKIKSGRFSAQKHIQEAFNLLDTNAASAQQRKDMRLIKKASIGMDAVEAFQEAFLRGRG